MSKASFQLVYDGPALEGNEMAARDLSSALIAMDALLGEADEVINKGKTSTTLNVKASFKTGSFKIDFSSAQSVAERFRDLLASDTTSAVINAHAIVGIVAGLIYFIKMLGGRKITKMELVDGKVKVHVSDSFLTVEREAIDLYRNHRIRQALEQAILHPLEKDGVDHFAIIQETAVTVEVTKEESGYFAAGTLEQLELEDTKRITHLHLIAPSFQGGDKWRVNDGGSNFFVSMDDQNFIERVLRGEIEFGASTILKVALREVQFTDQKGQMKKECTVQKVLEVIKPHEQMDLPLTSSGGAEQSASSHSEAAES